MLEGLFPNERKFFAQFDIVAQQVTSSARLLQQGFDQPDSWPERSARIQEIVRDTDAASHAIDLGMERMFVAPLDREDIHLLSAQLRSLADIIGGTARRAVTFRARDRRDPAVQLAQTLGHASGEIEAAVAHIRETSLVLERCRAIKQCEEEGDAIHTSAVSALFEGKPDPIDVIRWKALYDQLEEALDACEDVANTLETIALKHT